MTWLAILHYVNLFFAGMLAGIETAVHYGLGAPPTALNVESQIRLRQVLVLKLRVLVPVFFLPNFASAIALTAINGPAPGLWFRYTGLLALLTWIGVRLIRTVPINSATLTWNPLAPPNDWRFRVDEARQRHQPQQEIRQAEGSAVSSALQQPLDEGYGLNRKSIGGLTSASAAKAAYILKYPSTG